MSREGSQKDGRVRLDQTLVERGLAPSRARAQSLILAGLVRVDGLLADKAGKAVAEGARVEVIGPDHPWVSRGGVKLAAALAAFAVDPSGKRCLDVGASTGGFTDVLLERGAVQVVALDVGRGQLDWKLRSDPRVVVIEGVNARLLAPEDVPGPMTSTRAPSATAFPALSARRPSTRTRPARIKLWARARDGASPRSTSV